MIFYAFDDEAPPVRPKTQASASASSSAPKPKPLPPQPSVYVAPVPSGDAGVDAGKPGAKSIERAAADAVAVGDYAKAIILYQQLVDEEPENPTWKETIRILKGKTGK